MKLLDRIERHLKESHISATRFGRRAVGDPRFVLDLRSGRRPRRRTVERVEAYLTKQGEQSSAVRDHLRLG
jgi:2,4-dienoyl-CoA reductase-like NADH-dependent reductase (Old Yellow Enzyme family)